MHWKELKLVHFELDDGVQTSLTGDWNYIQHRASPKTKKFTARV